MMKVVSLKELVGEFGEGDALICNEAVFDAEDNGELLVSLGTEIFDEI